MTPDDMTRRIEALCDLTGMTVRALDIAGEQICMCGDDCNYCRMIRPHLPGSMDCNALHALAGRRALDLGEAYALDCTAGVCLIAVPAVTAYGYESAILMGPFVMGEYSPDIASKPAQRLGIQPGNMPDLLSACRALPALSPRRAEALCRVVRYMFDDLPGGNPRPCAHGSCKALSIYGGFSSCALTYPRDIERQLAYCIMGGDAQGINALLNELMGRALFLDENDIEGIKVRTSALYSLLERTAAGATGCEPDMNRELMRLLWQTESMDDICYIMQDMAACFCASALNGRKSGEVRPSAYAAIRHALSFIALNYARDITLSSVAREVRLSESYFSGMFKKFCGVSFTEYLNTARIEESKRLLAQGGLTLSEVAARVGFASQSYFSKVFRRVTGASPSQYVALSRAQNHARH